MNKTFDTMPATAMTALGSFEITSGHLRLSDPCYEANERYAPVVAAKPGTWQARAGAPDDYLPRLFLAHHTDCNVSGAEWEEVGSVGVDSGCYGVFDNAFANYGQDLHDCYCDECGNGESVGVVFEQGAAIGNGFGDGSFPAYVIRDKGIVVAVLIGAIDDDESDES